MYVFNFLLVNTDAASYDEKHQHKILSQNEQRKEGKYLDDCLEIQSDFTPIVLLVDRVMGEEKKVATKQLDVTLSKKWDS